MNEPSVVSAFVSWAHASPGWTEEQASAWMATVATFTSALRLQGINADVDLFHLNEPGIDWTRYGPKAIADADVTLVAVSPGWRERWEGRNEPTVGAGAVQEADQLHGHFQRDQSDFQRRVLLVILPGASLDDVPNDLRRLQRFVITSFDLAGLETLLRTLLRKPTFVPPPLGAPPDLPPRQVLPATPGTPPTDDTTDVVQLRLNLARLDASLAALPPHEVGDGPHLPWYRARLNLEQNRAVVLGELAAREAATDADVSESPPAASRPTSPPPTDAPLWRPLEAPREPVPTLLDARSPYSSEARLELHLVARTRKPVLATAELRAAQDRLYAMLDEQRPRGSRLGGDPDDGWRVEAVLEGDVAVAVASQARTFREILPEGVIELRLSRYGDVAVCASLARDRMGSVVSEDSLLASGKGLMLLAVGLVPSGVDEVVPMLRLGPLSQVAPGDPASVGSRTSGTFPWTSRGVIATSGADAVSTAMLATHVVPVAQELVDQLVAALNRK